MLTSIVWPSGKATQYERGAPWNPRPPWRTGTPVGPTPKAQRREMAVEVVAPAVEAACEDRRVALVVPAYPVAAVPAGVQQHLDPILLVARHDHRFLAHARQHVVARLRDLALEADEQPGARE